MQVAEPTDRSSVYSALPRYKPNGL